MILKLKYPILLIITSFLFYSCEKEYSIEGNVIGGTSVFTFTGAPATCTNALVTGTYTVDTALGATNVVTISVDVTTTGTYTIATAAVNGITFTGSGAFTTTGPQTISLTGSGIPLSAGTFTFTPGINGCSFPVTVSKGGGSSGGSAVYTLNGAPGNCTNFSPGGTYAAGTPLVAGNFASVSVNVTAIGTYIISTNTVDGIAFSGTGTFTATGTQVVQLPGSGTPLVGGTFDFIPGTNGCTFSLTVTGSSSGSAVFTYNGSPGSCTNAVPAGTYTAFTALAASNTVTIDVNVTTIGTWSVSTPPVNGFSFSGAGSFTTTGAQSITLAGTGTPAAEGVYDFTPTNNGCSFSVTVNTGTPATDFLKCTIAGVARTFNVNVAGANPDPALFVISGEETPAATSPTFQISLANPSGIAAGTYNRFSATNLSTYCMISFDDGVSTTPWASGILQSGTFSVIVTSFTTTRIQGTFSGTLYDNDGVGTVTKAVTAGQFSLPY